MGKKKYTVNVHYDVVLTKTVVAETEEEAIDKAIEELTDEDLNGGEVVDEEGCITDVEEIEPEADEKLINGLFGVLGFGVCGDDLPTESKAKSTLDCLREIANKVVEEMEKARMGK